jgi:hypothetical protein
MWQGSYQRWNPVPKLEGIRMWCEAVHDDWEGFRIWFRPEDRTLPMLVVHFGHRLLYVNSDEGDRLSRVSEPPSGGPHVFWQVHDSSLVAEFQRQSLGIRADNVITHYAFLSSSDCVDVLSLEAPTFRLGSNVVPG